jgi:hypothetical protein
VDALAMIVGPAPLWLLAAAFAASLPVALHLLARRRARVINFPAARFIALAAEGPARRATLRDRLLMLLRSAALALLVLAASGMHWEASAPLALAGDDPRAPSLARDGITPPRNLVIVLDASASMTRTQGGVTLFDHARQRAAESLGSLRPGVDRAGVVIARRDPQPPLPAMTTNIAALGGLVTSASVTLEHADIAQAIAAAAELTTPHPAQLLVLTDAQGTSPRDIERAADRHRKFERVQVIDVSASAVRTNLAVLSVRPGTPAADGTRLIAAQIANFSDEPRLARIDIRARAATASASRMLSPSETAWLEASLAPLGSPADTLRVHVDDPGFTADNTIEIPLPRTDDPPIIVSSRTPLAALGPIRAAVDAWAASPSRVIEPGDAAALDTDAPVVLISPITLDDASINVLQRRASRGAPLLVFAWSPLDAPPLRALGLLDLPLPAQPDMSAPAPATTDAALRLAPATAASDALRAAALGLERASVHAPRAVTHETDVTSDLAPPRPATSLLLAGEHPVVTLHALDRASVGVFSIDPTLGSAPASASAWFAVLVARLLDAAVDGALPRTIFVGEIPSPGMSPTTEPGLIAIPGPPGAAPQMVGVTLDPRESDLRPATPTSTSSAAETSQPPDVAPSTTRTGDDAASTERAAVPLAPWLIAAALIALCLDSLVGSRPRNRQQRGALRSDAPLPTSADQREDAA